MGDVCEVGTRIQFVMDRDSDSSHIIHLTPCVDSDILHVNALGKSIVILNSYKAATELLDQRSSTYSSRYVCLITLLTSEFTEILLFFN